MSKEMLNTILSGPSCIIVFDEYYKDLLNISYIEYESEKRYKDHNSYLNSITSKVVIGIKKELQVDDLVTLSTEYNKTIIYINSKDARGFYGAWDPKTIVDFAKVLQDYTKLPVYIVYRIGKIIQKLSKENAFMLMKRK